MAGFSLIIIGVLGAVMPVIGLWLVPVGLFVLSIDFRWAKRWNLWILRRARRVQHHYRRLRAREKATDSQ
ncbi:PGPGW domain-containing protein [Gammaproteobacteria bacterium]|nr:PGPGW domain-containing protein [Gammaproteobacteria bacterium]